MSERNMTEAEWVRLWSIKENGRYSQRIPRFPGYTRKLTKHKNSPAIPQDYLVRLRERGLTNDEIGEIVGVSRERVRQRIAFGREEGLIFTLIPKLTPEQMEEKSRRLVEARQAAREKETAEYLEGILNQRYGALLVHEVLTDPGKDKIIRTAKVECDCGVWKIVAVRNLRRGNTRSCGSKLHHPRGWTKVPANVIKLPDNYVEKLG